MSNSFHDQKMSPPTGRPYASEGHSVAGWTLVVMVLIGGLVGALAFIVATPWLFWVGMGIILAGLVTGKVLQLAGYGQHSAENSRATS